MTDSAEQQPPVNTLLTPLMAVATTLAGLIVAFFANSELAPVLLGGSGAVCREPDCVLGAGLWLVIGGFVALCAAMIISVVLALVRRRPSRRIALRRGLFVGIGCLLAYVIESVVIWVLV